MEKHLVVSVGKHVYLAMAKGVVAEGHVLIIPITHTPNSIELSKVSDMSSWPLYPWRIIMQDALDEVAKYKKSLMDYYTSKALSCVFFERNYRSQHLQIQA